MQGDGELSSTCAVPEGNFRLVNSKLGYIPCKCLNPLKSSDNFEVRLVDEIQNTIHRQILAFILRNVVAFVCDITSSGLNFQFNICSSDTYNHAVVSSDAKIALFKEMLDIVKDQKNSVGDFTSILCVDSHISSICSNGNGLLVGETF